MIFWMHKYMPPLEIERFDQNKGWEQVGMVWPGQVGGDLLNVREDGEEELIAGRCAHDGSATILAVQLSEMDKKSLGKPDRALRSRLSPGAIEIVTLGLGETFEMPILKNKDSKPERYRFTQK